jgi:hypothetical protein
MASRSCQTALKLAEPKATPKVKFKKAGRRKNSRPASLIVNPPGGPVFD